MFIYCLFVFGFSTSHLYFVEALSPRSNEATKKDVYYKNDLINIISSLNHLNDNLKVNNKEYKEMLSNDELSDSEKEKNLQEFLWLMRKNYNAQKQYNLIQNPAHSGARVYFIRNPDAIEEYKKYLEQKKMRPSRKRTIKNKLQDVRRKFMSRRAEDSNDRSERKSDTDNTDVIADYGTIRDEGLHQNLPSYNDNEDNAQYINDDKETYEEPLTEEKTPVDSLGKHKKDYQNVRAKNDFRREKSDWENNYSEIEKKWNPKKLKKSVAYQHKNNERSVKTNKRFDESDGKFDNRWDTTKRSKKNYDMDKQKFTTKEYFERKISEDNFKRKKKAGYGNPKKEFKHRNDFSSHARTSIPFVGKKGIYEED